MSRTDKYSEKIDAGVIGRKYDATKALAVKKMKAAMPQQIFVENMVKQVCNGVSTILLPYYIIFGKEVAMLKDRHNAGTLINELEILQRKWISRGLDLELLNGIKIRLVEEYVSHGYFRFDQSLLDGDDVLA